MYNFIILTLFFISSATIASSFTKKTFQKYINEYKTSLNNYVYSRVGHSLVIDANWDREIGLGGGAGGKIDVAKKIIHLRIDGALAKNKWITQDAVSFVLCHELGHMIAIYPLITNEINSDIFAIEECLPELWRNNTRVGNARDILNEVQNLPIQINAKCNQQREEDSLECKRIIRALYSGNIYRYYYGPSRWNKPLFEIETISGKPPFNLQCIFEVGLASVTLEKTPDCFIDLR